MDVCIELFVRYLFLAVMGERKRRDRQTDGQTDRWDFSFLRYCR